MRRSIIDSRQAFTSNTKCVVANPQAPCRVGYYIVCNGQIRCEICSYHSSRQQFGFAKHIVESVARDGDVLATTFERFTTWMKTIGIENNIFEQIEKKWYINSFIILFSKKKKQTNIQHLLQLNTRNCATIIRHSARSTLWPLEDIGNDFEVYVCFVGFDRWLVCVKENVTMAIVIPEAKQKQTKAKQKKFNWFELRFYLKKNLFRFLFSYMRTFVVLLSWIACSSHERNTRLDSTTSDIDVRTIQPIATKAAIKSNKKKEITIEK